MTFPPIANMLLTDDVLVAAKVRYEKIKVFCYYCDHLGHRDNACPELLEQHPHSRGSISDVEMVFEP